MILSKEQIKTIAKGVEHWEDGPEGGLIPRRFCTEQEEIYKSHALFFVRNRATSGVRLECRTDASALEMTLRAFAGSAKDWYGFDLKVDGKLWGHFEGTLQESDRIHWTCPLPQGEKHITLYLPCLTGVEILDVTLENATVCESVEYAERILVMGDSVTQGYTSHFPSMTYVAQMAAHRNADYLNQAIGGETFHPEILTPLEWQPTMAIISYGSNDWTKKTREQAAKDAEAFLNRFCQLWPGLPTVVLTPIWRADCMTKRKDDFRFEQIREIIEGIASCHPQINVISGAELFPQIEELFDDKLHPNELGYTLFAKRLCEALNSIKSCGYRKDER